MPALKRDRCLSLLVPAKCMAPFGLSESSFMINRKEGSAERFVREGNQ